MDNGRRPKTKGPASRRSLIAKRNRASHFLHFLLRTLFGRVVPVMPVVLHLRRRVVARQNADAAALERALGTPEVQNGAEPSLTHVQPSSALAGVPVNSAAPMSAPARMTILRMELSLLERPCHYAIGTLKYQVKRGPGGRRARSSEPKSIAALRPRPASDWSWPAGHRREARAPDRRPCSRPGRGRPIRPPGIRLPAAEPPRPRN